VAEFTDCLRTSAIYAPCAAGVGIEGIHSTGDVAHVYQDKFWCPQHCLYCHPPDNVFTEPMQTGVVSGEQGGLFE
jgi:hypothetical protein